MFNRILVGVDGSDDALKAVEVAAKLAHSEGAALTMLHVVQVSAIADQALRTSATEHLKEHPKTIMEKLSQDVLEQAKVRAVAAGLAEDRITMESADGNQAKCLIDATKRLKTDLVVVGGRGRGQLEGLLLGSVSQKVSALAPCACLIVR